MPNAAMTIKDGERETTLIYAERDLTVMNRLLVPEGEQFIVAAGVYDNFTVAGGQDAAAWTEKSTPALLQAARSLQAAIRAKPIPQPLEIALCLWRGIEFLDASNSATVFVRHHSVGKDGTFNPDPSTVLPPEVSALFKAIRAGDVERIRSLVAKGVDPNAENSQGASALSVAASVNVDALQVLLELGAEVNRRFTFRPRALKGHVAAGVTPLMYARSATAVKILLGHGADLNAQDDRGNTALMHAADHGVDEIVECLVRAGADVSIRRQRRPGRKTPTALELAQGVLAVLAGKVAAGGTQESALLRPYRRCIEILEAAASSGSGKT